MSWTIRRGIATAVTASAFLLGAGISLPAAQAGEHRTHRAQTAPLTQTNHACDGTLIGTAQGARFGFVHLVRPANGHLLAVVVLRHAQPNTTYNVRLIQVVAGNSDCQSVDATVTTDAHGNGSVTVHEAVLAGASTAWVAVNNKADFTQFYTSPLLTFSSSTRPCP